MQGFLNRINKTVEILWDDYSKKYPGFFYKDQNGRKNMPTIIAAQALRNLPDFPLYAKRYIDQDPTSWYFFMGASPLAGACDRNTAVKLFYDIFVKQLGLHSSYEQEGYDIQTAVDMEVLPADTDKNYKTYYEQQMEELAKAMGAVPDEEAEKEAAEVEFERKHGFRRDDPNIIDIDAEVDGVPVRAATSQEPGLQKAQQFAVGAPKRIFYCVDLHVPSEYELGYDASRRGTLGNGNRRNRLGSSNSEVRSLREEELDAMIQEAEQARILAYNGCKYGNAAPGGNILSLNGFAYYTNNELTCNYARPERVVNGSVTFEYGKEGAKTQADTFKNVNVVQYANGELRLRANMDGGIETMGQFLAQAKKAGAKKFQDIKSIRLDDPDNDRSLSLYGIGVDQNAPGNKTFPYAFLFDEENDTANKKDEFDEYKNMFESDDMEECDKCGDPECKDGEICGLKEAVLSQDDRDEIADMFAGYSGSGSSLGVNRQALDGFMTAHAAELQQLRKGQASGFGDFNAVRDLGSDDEQYESEEDIEKEIAGIVNEGNKDVEDDNETSETEKLIKEYSEVEDDMDEDDDELSEAVIRHVNMLSREIW